MATLCSAPQVSATEYAFRYDFTFSGTNTAGSPAWIEALFQDVSPSPGTVNLTLSAAGLTGNEFVSGVYFNLDPNRTWSDLAFINVSASSGLTLPGISFCPNNFKADGDGLYDILFSFATDNDGYGRFGVGDQVTYTITGSGLTADAFMFLSVPRGGSGPFLSAAHVQAIGTANDSAWIATQIPEPASAALFGLFAAGLLWRRRRS